MNNYAFVLKFLAPVFLLVGAMHLVLGLGADAMLGAIVPVEAMIDPTLDSQNRFYGISFTLYGVLLYLCSTDIPKYATVIRCHAAFKGLKRMVGLYVVVGSRL